ncbi:MAG: UDP-3-O-(3-hydroxymyristoyl)glucosamine N-acyltransferase [Firmicutes bacterium]|jgi:UDP-3-O-[3-hydroxymyristoyl] glucosamine N-acyltransferase|nr:UDP-3-O-(3-hydroxymyristoyl)glucosamine N-acyltransferase [Bacillota bacterium]MDH7494374.1 UDP-3-O-(3-hydroxymyristoyl)glucosamine N-acyltransferase [Bacillota bacterium]
METRREQTLGDIARIVGGELFGDPMVLITGVSPIDTAGPGEITFAEDSRRAVCAAKGQAAAVVVPRGVRLDGKPFIAVDNPRLAFAEVLEVFRPEPGVPAEGIDPRSAVDPTAIVSARVRIGPNVTVEAGATIGEKVVLYPGVYIGRDATVGAGTVIHPNVVVGERVVIGRNVIIHAGVVIGADGFGYVESGGVRHKIPQIGTVIIEDDVEIGANACVDRATMGATVIGRGTKVDNLVQIGHNVKVGEDCVIVGLTGVGGSSEIGASSTIAGGVGVKDHVKIGPRSVVAAHALVCTNVPPGAFVSGSPARPHREQLAIDAAARKLPELLERVRLLEAEIEEMKRAR